MEKNTTSDFNNKNTNKSVESDFNLHTDFDIIPFVGIFILIFFAATFIAKDEVDTISNIKSTVQTEIENTPYDSLNSHKMSENVSLDVVVNDNTHKQVFVYIKNHKYTYQLVVSKNDDGTDSIYPL